ncbi:hypothetical protein OS493_028070 [Desmophyllum pertusum]|uniref:Uncharacterized protein n=1 Tax=Desmophyllum pertusum TaxID=174260 RepID=A0A9W9ZZJ5_9CNID|nr:hypothetical protein OS493_028070 [Desmophyllum pertusum]
MSAQKFLFAILLLISSAAVHKAFAGRIADKIREKRWYDGECVEEVLERSPECLQRICPHGEKGQAEIKMTPCSEIPKRCPKKIFDEEAACCPEKCVCGNGENMFLDGDTFTVDRDNEKWECKCKKDVHGVPVPRCREVFFVPTKKPFRPPPIFPPRPPPGLFPPAGSFPLETDAN